MSIRRKVGLWIRVSTEDQAKGESPEHHEQRGRSYAQFKDWEIAEFYNLSGVSGKSIINHPETQRMLNDIKTGKITGLIFSKLARLARNTKELLDIADIFQKYNADLISLQESIDTSSPVGRLFYTIIAAMAQWEREEIASRVAASVPIRAKLGKSLGGESPLGYQWQDKKLIINIKEAESIKRLFEIFKDCGKITTTAKRLNEEGYRTRIGEFGRTTVDRILKSTIYKGSRRTNYTKSLGDKSHWALKPEQDWVFNEVEPIISSELWDACHYILQQREGKYSPPPRMGKYLFSGLTYCEDCGEKMYMGSFRKTKKYRCRKCENKIEEDVLKAEYLNGLKTMVLNPERLKDMENETSNIAEKEGRLKNLKNECQRAKNEIDKYLSLYGKNKIDDDVLSIKINTLSQKKKQLEKEIPRMEGMIDFEKINSLSREYVLDQAKTFSELWPKLNVDEQRSLILNLTESIKIGKSLITLKFFALPDFSKSVNNVRDFMD